MGTYRLENHQDRQPRELGGGDDAIIHTALRDGTLVWKKSSQERKDKPLNMRGRTREQLYGTDVNQRHRDVDKAGKQGILCLNEIRRE